MDTLKNNRKDEQYLVFGKGKTGKACIKFLEKQGYKVLSYDDKDKKDTSKIFTFLDTKKDKIVVSPGVPPWNVVFRMLLKRGMYVTNDLDLFWKYNKKAQFIGVTGTNGKSTVAYMLWEIAKQQWKCALGGNIGVPAFEMDKSDKYILEVSSYQASRIINIQFAFGLIINLDEDHLEWHGNMDNYINAKINLLRRSLCPMLCIDDDYTSKLLEIWRGPPLITISLHKTDADYFLYNNKIYSHGKCLFDLKDLNEDLHALHNTQNVLCAVALADQMYVDEKYIKSGLQSFIPLPFRQQNVGTIKHNDKNLMLINDSKSTTIASSVPAIKRFNNILWLAGGIAKQNMQHQDYDPLIFKNINHAFLFGQDRDICAQFCLIHNISYVFCNDLDDCVKHAIDYFYNNCIKDSVLLLSPACASFDLFKNFEDRGVAFNNAVSPYKC